MSHCELEPLAFTDTKDTEGHYHELVNANPNYPILIKSVLWLSVENFMQAQKFQGTPLATKIQKTYDTEQAKSLERNSAVLDFVKHDWHKIRDEVMLEGLRAKFTQHKDLKKLLLRTGSRDIILKDSIPGSYWGRGSDGMGTNKLGQLLMRTRAEMMGKTPTVETDKMHSEFQDYSPNFPSPDKPPKNTIYFHDDKYPFFEFSPYFPHEVRINGTKWRTVSHYYLGQRFAGSKLEVRIQECRTAGEAMKIAYTEDNHDFVRTDWKDVKDQVMKTALKAKFIQYPEAKHLLLSTGHKSLVHHCNDAYWGDSMDGDGQNMLGNFLMDIRKELQEKDSDVRPILQPMGGSNQVSSPIRESRKSRQLASLHRDTNTSVITSERSNQLCGLSVYSDHPVTVSHKRWPSLAHFYNAMKFEGTRLEDRIRAIPSSEEVPYVAYQYREGVVKGWVEKRDRIMLQGLRAKFNQHPELVDLLAMTNRRLVFHSEEDSYYGDGGDGSGQNMLGTLLEDLRSEFDGTAKRHQEASRSPYYTSPPQEVPITRSLTSQPYHADITAPLNTCERLRFSALDSKYKSFLPSSEHSIETQDGRKWYTVEHFYHASKFHGGQFDDMISRESSLEEVRKLVYSNMYQRQVRSDFNQMKDNYMLHGLRLKFEQHETLRRFLLQTGTATLIYDTEKDEYWGYGIAGSGKNRLGGLLMLMRKEFKELSRVEWQCRQQQRHNSPPALRQSRTMTFADNPRDLLDRFIPSQSQPPALTHQQSFYDSHNSPKHPSPKPLHRASFQHQESFVASNNGRNDTFGRGDAFGFSSMKDKIGEIGRSHDPFIDPSVLSSPPRFDASEQSFSVTDDFLLANRQRGSYLRKQRSLSNPDLCDLK